MFGALFELQFGFASKQNGAGHAGEFSEQAPALCFGVGVEMHGVSFAVLFHGMARRHFTEQPVSFGKSFVSGGKSTVSMAKSFVGLFPEPVGVRTHNG